MGQPAGRLKPFPCTPDSSWAQSAGGSPGARLGKCRLWLNYEDPRLENLPHLHIPLSLSPNSSNRGGGSPSFSRMWGEKDTPSTHTHKKAADRFSKKALSVSLSFSVQSRLKEEDEEEEEEKEELKPRQHQQHLSSSAGGV